MSKHILITGGAGFIGSHLADALVARGHRVRALDNLAPQVHGRGAARPAHLNPDVELQVGDVCDPEAVRRALDGIDAVFHFAAVVGIAQSMYEIAGYTRANNLGTAVLLQELTARAPLERLIVASSMALYGEGLYLAPDGTRVDGMPRPLSQMTARQWELRNERGQILAPLPTPETKKTALTSVYALSKFDQERLCLMIGQTYDIPTVALRFFNVYGPRQALSNPYTGVIPIFTARLLNDQPPLINEDGLQQRDFVSVYDVVDACLLALEHTAAPGRAFNVGSGRGYTINEIAERVGRLLGKSDIRSEVTGKFRKGDVRHCFADITLARETLGYAPRVDFEMGLAEVVEWYAGRPAIDRVPQAQAELEKHGLTL